MKKLILLFVFLCLIACSSNSPIEPEANQQADDETTSEEGNNDDEMSEEEPFTFPFSLSIVLKDFSNPAQREGQFESIDFLKGLSNPSESLNLTQTINLDLDAGIVTNGQENVLVFLQKTGTIEKEYLTYNLDTQQIYSANRTELLLTSENCFFDGTQLAANSNGLLFFNYDLCQAPDDIIPVFRNQSTDENIIFPKIEAAHMGDSFNLLWGSDYYYYYHFNNLNEDAQGQSIDQDGLIVYNATSNEIIYENRTSERKIPLVCKQKMVLKRNNTLLDLIDLESGQTLFSNEVSNSDGLIIGDRLGQAEIYQNKVGLMIYNFEEQKLFPGVYDFQSNSSITFDSEVYREYFRNSGIPVPNPIRQPKEYKFDLESETFAVLYHGFTQGFIENDNPDFIGLVFMNFEGEILHEYKFDERQWIEQIIVKR
ncbi:hypothetical protein [uncultured Croceitalea sp.]|uniref:hypothetical protein n=1 Tax=uncultured Croceitalea sp. TaxID=1798908 RepID=UPI0033057193